MENTIMTHCCFVHGSRSVLNDPTHISAYLCKFLISEGVVASQRCMASEHYFLLVALVFFRMSSARGSRACPRVFALRR